GESIVAMTVVEGDMETVATRVDGEIQHGVRIAPEISTPDTLLIEFLDWVDREQDCSDSGDTSLIHSFRVVPEIVVVYAIDLPIILVRAVSIHRELRIESGRKLQQLAEVAPIQRQFLNRPGAHHCI